MPLAKQNYQDIFPILLKDSGYRKWQLSYSSRIVTVALVLDWRRAKNPGSELNRMLF